MKWISSNKISKYKFYPVRGSNKLSDLKKWSIWAKKNYPEQKFLFVNEMQEKLKDKKYKNYWKMRYKSGLENKYAVYGSY